jgi:hypothetical protein
VPGAARRSIGCGGAVDLPPGAPLLALGEKEAGWKVEGGGTARVGVERRLVGI